MAVARRTIGTRSDRVTFAQRMSRAWRRVRSALTGPSTRRHSGRQVDPHALRTLDDWIMRGGPRMH
jgi:hypothetical protein